MSIVDTLLKLPIAFWRLFYQVKFIHESYPLDNHMNDNIRDYRLLLRVHDVDTWASVPMAPVQVVNIYMLCESIDIDPETTGYFFSKCNSTFSCRSFRMKYCGVKALKYNKYLSTLWILMAWCFSTRASVATVLNKHPCVSRCVRVNGTSREFWWPIS